MNDPTTIETLVNLAAVLRQDEETPRVDRRHRDRAIGRDLASRPDQPARQLTEWLRPCGRPRSR